MGWNSTKRSAAARVVLCGLVFAAAQSLSAALVSALGWKMLERPAGAGQAELALVTLLGSPLLPLALAPLAARLPGEWLGRAARLAVFVYVSFGLNTLVEARIFTTLVAPGSFAGMCAFYVLPSAALALAVAAAFPSHADPVPPPQRTPAGWAARAAVAWLAFPAVYLLFGSMVAPVVLPAYERGIAGLALPPMAVIVPVQLGRSLLSLVSAAPVVIPFRGSRKELAVRLGWAFWVLTGLYGMWSAVWLPWPLRVAHSVEIGADSFAWAAVVAWAVHGPGERRGQKRDDALPAQKNLQK
jgi:hypothetical protein